MKGSLFHSTTKALHLASSEGSHGEPGLVSRGQFVFLLSLEISHLLSFRFFSGTKIPSGSFLLCQEEKANG